MVTKVSDLRPNTRPVDPDVKVPAAVLRASAAADAARAAAYPGSEPPSADPAATPPANSDGITIAEPPVAPQPAPPVTPVGNDPSPTPTPVPEETWEHKFKSAEGRRIKAETANAQLVDRLTALENLIQDLRAAPAPATTATPTPAPSRLVTEQEENEFGAEMLDVVGRRAREVVSVSPELAELRAQMQAMEQKLTGTVTTVKRNARSEMLSSLDSKMPEWRQVNDMSEFKSWLALPDPYFGAIRHNALLSAFEQNDTPRVLNFFKGFVSELAATTPAEDLPAPLIPAAPQPDKPGLESLAAPGRARTPAQTPTPVEKQIITTADVNAFYDAKRRGAYNGREAEFNALEQELFKAQREGRVRAV